MHSSVKMSKTKYINKICKIFYCQFQTDHFIQIKLGQHKFMIWRQSYQTFFLHKQRIFPFFATKLGCCTVHTFFSYATNSQAYQQKSENRKNESLVGSTPEPQNKFFTMICIFFAVCEENVGNVPHAEGCVADVRGGSNELVVGRKCRTRGNRKFDFQKFSVSG